MEEFGKLLRRTLRGDIEIQVINAVEDAAVRVDVGQMEQVLMNLAVNAQDAMPGGGSLILGLGEAILDEEFARQNPGESRPRMSLSA